MPDFRETGLCQINSRITIPDDRRDRGFTREKRRIATSSRSCQVVISFRFTPPLWRPLYSAVSPDCTDLRIIPVCSLEQVGRLFRTDVAAG